jgi:hypothetical protein
MLTLISNSVSFQFLAMDHAPPNDDHGSANHRSDHATYAADECVLHLSLSYQRHRWSLAGSSIAAHSDLSEVRAPSEWT